MSINEVIKKYLLIEKIYKLSSANKQYNYCSAYTYENCTSCKETKKVKCYKKIVYQSSKQISSSRWHLYFVCSENHLVVRWVIFEKNTALVGRIKN